jgi:hypothetical protein
MSDQSTVGFTTLTKGFDDSTNRRQCSCTRPIAPATQVLVDVRELAVAIRELQLGDRRGQRCANVSIYTIGILTIVATIAFIIYITSRVLTGLHFS